MASVEMKTTKNGKLYFRITVSCGFNGSGKRLRKVEKFVPKSKSPKAAEREAKHYAELLEEKYRNGTLSISENILYKDFCEKWFENWATDKLKPNQAENYQSYLNLHVIPLLGGMKINSIRTKDCINVIEHLKQAGLAPKSIRAIASAMRSTFRYALRLQLISIDPSASDLDLPSLKKQAPQEAIKCFDVAESQRFLNCLSMKYPKKMGGRKRKDSSGAEYSVKPYVTYKGIPFQYQVFFTLSLLGGFRRAELVALNWEDVDFENRTITVSKAVIKTSRFGQIITTPKTESSYRTVYLPQKCIDLLEELLDIQKEQCQLSVWKGMPLERLHENAIFTQQDGTRMFIDSPSSKFAKILKMYNAYIMEQAEGLQNEEERKKKLSEMLPVVTLHDLRHSFCTLLISNGVDIVTVSRLAGHSNPSVTTNIYAHLLRKNAQDAAITFERLFTTETALELRA